MSRPAHCSSALRSLHRTIPLLLIVAMAVGASISVVDVRHATGDELPTFVPKEEPKGFRKFGQKVGSVFKSKSAKKGSSTDGTIEDSDPTSLNHKEADPDAQLHLRLANLQEAAGDLHGAEAQFRKALEVEPNGLEPLLGYARLAERMRRAELAEQLYQQAIQAHPKHPTAYNDLALCYAKMNRLEEASGLLKKAVALQPTRKLYRNNLAMILVQMGLHREAFDQLAVAHGPAIAHYNLGFLLNQQGKFDAAFHEFQQAVALEPDFADARQWIAILAEKVSPDAPRAQVAGLPNNGPGAGQPGRTAPTVRPVNPEGAPQQAETHAPAIRPPYTGPLRSVDPVMTESDEMPPVDVAPQSDERPQDIESAPGTAGQTPDTDSLRILPQPTEVEPSSAEPQAAPSAATRPQAGPIRPRAVPVAQPIGTPTVRAIAAPTADPAVASLPPISPDASIEGSADSVSLGDAPTPSSEPEYLTYDPVLKRMVPRLRPAAGDPQPVTVTMAQSENQAVENVAGRFTIPDGSQARAPSEPAPVSEPASITEPESVAAAVAPATPPMAAIIRVAPSTAIAGPPVVAVQPAGTAQEVQRRYFPPSRF